MPQVLHASHYTAAQGYAMRLGDLRPFEQAFACAHTSGRKPSSAGTEARISQNPF